MRSSMRNAFAGVWLGLLGGAALADQPSVRVCANAQFEPPCARLSKTFRDLSELGMANAISSFAVESGAWMMCTRRDFKGVCHVFEGSEHNLSGTPFQDSIVSLRPVGGWHDTDSAGGGRGDGVAELFEDAGFGGARLTVIDAAPDLQRMGFNDRVSSMRIHGGRWQACSDAGFRGRCIEISSSIGNFQNLGFNDQVSSLRRIDLGGQDGGYQDEDGDVALLYEDANYAGRQISVTESSRDLSRWGFNDRVSSVRLKGGRWQACTDADFGGRCVILTGSVGNFAALGVNDQVSSIRRLHDGGGNAWGGNGGGWSQQEGGFDDTPQDAVVLYADADYRGRQIRVRGAVQDLARLGFNDQVSSIRVSSGRWEVCSDAGFKGRCETIYGSVSNFDRRGMNDEISSIRQLR
ncbi:beta/gamma crystallin-related protein [Niveibacterium sp. 24ML]|uniref:beta/gamma crystallin-related protein n=1 Tax=Niveibacterium sp. 24ML TaxID=2985512 RepID=UPI00226DE664|nr:beta/gamma crystallin-related protein [Niveibacterium sp. 24ML]MCX9156361.1 beta/gamma crystallin-related protein [Niveibacterium sp. 24ML]